MKTIAIITARSGSKSVPNKNLLKFGNDTAISLRIKSARRALPECEIVISTDSPEYARIAVSEGVEAPFLRPKDLAADTSATSDVIIHALEWLSGHGRQYENLILIEPSSPFCRPIDLITGYKMLLECGGPVVSVRESHPNPIFISGMGKDGSYAEIGARLSTNQIRRQDFESVYTPNGCFYAAKVSDFLSNKSFYTSSTRAFAMPSEYSIEIDEPSDALYAQWLWNSGVIDQNFWSPS